MPLVQMQFSAPNHVPPRAGIVLVVRENSNLQEQVLCSAVPVDEYHLLTAAHCIDQFKKHQQRAALAARSSEYTQRSIALSSWSIHPEYSPRITSTSRDLDVAIIRLTEPIAVAESFTAQEAPFRFNTVRPGLWMRGFSPIRLKAKDPQLLLHSPQAWLPLVQMRNKGSEEKHALRAGENRSAPCPGDSGSPVWRLAPGQLELAGIIVQGNCEGGEARMLSLAAIKGWMSQEIRRFSGAPTMEKLLSKTYPLHLFADARTHIAGRE